LVLERVHVAAAVLFVAAIVVQVFLAGAALANLGGSGNFATHIEFGYTGIGVAWLILLVLYIVQTILPAFKTSAPSIAALHPVNALLLFVVAAWYARRAWRAALA
jgi:hypothetical protein